MLLGRFQLGQTVPLFLVTTDVNNTPQVPNFPPTMKVWAGDTLVLKALMPIVERFVLDGHFLARIFLGPSYAVGLYTVTYLYQVGSYQGVKVDNFEIMPGGNTDGNVMSMYFYKRPQANFIVQGLDSGKIVAGRNPTL